VPFEEDEKDPSIWFLDHSYLETMFRMFKKVNGASRRQRQRPCPTAGGPLTQPPPPAPRHVHPTLVCL
jgi:hypothetical protein